MAGAGKKTFTAGEVLTASDVNSYLGDQAVMYFAGTAARASAIPTPSVGMTSYIGVTGTATIPQIETYTGSAWQTPYGTTLLANVSFTTASTITVDNVFSSGYSNFIIIPKISAASTSPMDVKIYGRANGADETSVPMQRLYAFSSTVGTSSPTNTIFELGSTYPSLTFQEIKIYKQTVNNFVGVSCHSVNTDNSAVKILNIFHGWSNASNAWDGFKLFTSAGTITGTLQVYGYRRS